MCQKGSNLVKQFYAVMLTSACSAPKSLQVFKLPPTEKQLQFIIENHVIGKTEVTPFIYSEKPTLQVVPISIPVDILLN
jgi:hypothetical protein